MARASNYSASWRRPPFYYDAVCSSMVGVSPKAQFYIDECLLDGALEVPANLVRKYA